MSCCNYQFEKKKNLTQIKQNVQINGTDVIRVQDGGTKQLKTHLV